MPEKATVLKVETHANVCANKGAVHSIVSISVIVFYATSKHADQVSSDISASQLEELRGFLGGQKGTCTKH